jgi:hypothetical protein
MTCLINFLLGWNFITFNAPLWCSFKQIIEATPKSGHFGLKSSNVLIINNPSLKAGVIQRPDLKGFSPKWIFITQFSVWTQLLNFQ